MTGPGPLAGIAPALAGLAVEVAGETGDD